MQHAIALNEVRLPQHSYDSLIGLKMMLVHTLSNIVPRGESIRFSPATKGCKCEDIGEDDEKCNKFDRKEGEYFESCWICKRKCTNDKYKWDNWEYKSMLFVS